MRRGEARVIAFGGMMAALATTIMCLGGLIPIATFTTPVISMLILAYVTKICGKRIGWAWYGAVAILGLMLAPDKEAAAVFTFIGFYPIVKPVFDRMAKHIDPVFPEDNDQRNQRADMQKNIQHLVGRLDIGGCILNPE